MVGVAGGGLLGCFLWILGVFFVRLLLRFFISVLFFVFILLLLFFSMVEELFRSRF